MSWLEGSRARLRLLFKRRAAESRNDEEFRFHLEMETDRLVREAGLSRDEARRRAMVAFGGVQNHRESLRDGSGLAWLGGLSLDLKLGFRMLVKYPGLTIVGGFAMAFGIWFGAVTFQMWNVVTSTALPLPDGDRVVRIQDWDTRALHDEDRVLYDYQVWRSARSITDLGAYHDANVNLVGADGGALPVAAAEVTASAFRIAPERPLLGRVLRESDERPGAEPVVVLGYKVWNSRFDNDPRIVGRTVKIGNSFATVVGVMPEGFAFPVAHEMWLPLRTNVAGAEPRRGAEIKVFGKLASGMSLQNAQAEFASMGKRLAAEHPEAYAQIRPYVTPYAQLSLNNADAMGFMTLSNIFVIALLVVVCSTVALLLFARAASREAEILVRSALGASRRRIVMQLFAEALVLSGVAAVAGLAGAQFALSRLGGPYLEMNYGVLPFWMSFNLSPITILYALALAVIGAVVAGVMPARKITRGLGSKLRVGPGGGDRVSFGGVWTAVIVTQVALTVALPSVVMLIRGESKRVNAYDAGFPTQEYLGVTLGLDDALDDTMTPAASAAARARVGPSLEELRARLEAEPGVAGVTFVDALPAEDHDALRAEVVSLPGTAPSWVHTASVAPGYFKVLQAPVVSGRGFSSADAGSGVRVAIVDKGFVDLVMSGRNPVGHRVRLEPSQMDDSTAARLPLYEIVGVVKELGIASAAMPQRAAGLYLPAVPGSQGADKMIVHTRGDPLALVPRVRDLTTAVDPSLRVEKVTRLDKVMTPLLWLLQLWERIIIGLTGVALVLSLAGIYAVLSYIVARRTREIGVRVARGASARRVISSIFRRPLTQVSLGVVAGAAFIAVAAYAIQLTTQFHVDHPRGLSLGETALLVGYAILMLAVCTLACVVPTRRALRVQPTEALRAE
jgi:predicted permease